MAIVSDESGGPCLSVLEVDLEGGVGVVCVVLCVGLHVLCHLVCSCPVPDDWVVWPLGVHVAVFEDALNSEP